MSAEPPRFDADRKADQLNHDRLTKQRTSHTMPIDEAWLWVERIRWLESERKRLVELARDPSHDRLVAERDAAEAKVETLTEQADRFATMAGERLRKIDQLEVQVAELTASRNLNQREHAEYAVKQTSDRVDAERDRDAARAEVVKYQQTTIPILRADVQALKDEVAGRHARKLEQDAEVERLKGELEETHAAWDQTLEIAKKEQEDYDTALTVLRA